MSVSWGPPMPHLDALVDEGLERKRQREYLEYQRGFKAMMVAPTLELYHALLRGEDVPLSLLKEDAVARYGLRRAS